MTDGRVVVVTGASSGIGRATAEALAARGDAVVLAARSAETLAQVARDCDAAGGRALAVPTDVADGDAVEALAARAVEHFGRVDVWINDAAVMAYGRFEETPAEVHRKVVETNLFGQIHGARAALPRFRRQGHGVLVTVGSLYGKMTSPYVSAYVTSKYALIGFNEVLRQELADAPGIHACLVLPASVDTPIFRHTANYVGREARPVPPVSRPERVVKAILRVVDRPRAVVVVGNVGRVLAWGHSAFPRLYERLARPAMDVGGLRREAAQPGPGNVFEPMPEWNTVSGDWRRVPLPVTVAGSAALAATGAWALRRRWS